MTGLVGIICLSLALASFGRARKATDPDAARTSRTAGWVAVAVGLAAIAYAVFDAFNGE